MVSFISVLSLLLVSTTNALPGPGMGYSRDLVRLDSRGRPLHTATKQVTGTVSVTIPKTFIEQVTTTVTKKGTTTVTTNIDKTVTALLTKVVTDKDFTTIITTAPATVTAAAATVTAGMTTISCNIPGYGRGQQFISSSRDEDSNFDTCKNFCSADPKAVSFVFNSGSCYCLNADVDTAHEPNSNSPYRAYDILCDSASQCKPNKKTMKTKQRRLSEEELCLCIANTGYSTLYITASTTSLVVRNYWTSTSTIWTTSSWTTTATNTETVPATITVSAMRIGTETVTQTQRRTAMFANFVTVTVTNIRTVTLSVTRSLSTVNFNTVFLTNVDTVVEADENTAVITDTVTARTTLTSTSVVMSLVTTTVTGPEVTVGGGTTTVWGS
ncbi:hypothetical protein FPANT_11477 [Fusarium pseudoanthophilum]|uniref:Apple domain-containing protein n=1 Tax=Fusarium pseudoanthophilum TaxID=48495 RepID=A0A8H5KMN9_9HYPO|nr:hypothetical protein FPANT_11477 [Fusarium pseudoanthophilum]